MSKTNNRRVLLAWLGVSEDDLKPAARKALASRMEDEIFIVHPDATIMPSEQLCAITGWQMNQNKLAFRTKEITD